MGFHKYWDKILPQNLYIDGRLGWYDGKDAIELSPHEQECIYDYSDHVRLQSLMVERKIDILISVGLIVKQEDSRQAGKPMAIRNLVLTVLPNSTRKLFESILTRFRSPPILRSGKCVLSSLCTSFTNSSRLNKTHM